MNEKNIKNNENSRYRNLSGIIGTLWKVLLAMIPVIGVFYILSLYRFINLSFMREQYIGLFLAVILFCVYIGVPAVKKVAHYEKIPFYDWIFALLGLVVGFYIAINYPSIISNFGVVTIPKIVLGILAVFLVLEALRRFIGWSLVTVVLVFLLYAFVAPYMPGAFRGQQTSPELLFIYLYLDTNSLLDLLGLAATIGLAFVLFGQALIQFNGGEIFNNLSLKIFGRFRGGPAKASITGSGMVGSITGDPISNIVLTGSVTIPLMIRTGYARAQAGAIEAVASVGGIFAPPVMGIVAFMIADNLGIPYKDVAIAGILPALLYFTGLFMQVDLLAVKQNIGSSVNDNLPSIMKVLKTSLLLVPIFGVLVYYLFVKGYPPQTAGVYSSIVAIIILLLQKEVRENIINRIFTTLRKTGAILMELSVILSAAGFMVGIFGITGLGFNLSLVLTDFAKHGMFILLIACAIVCIILGMGLPGIAAYAIVAALVVPSLVELGVNPLAAHFFVFYFAMVSNFTPPMAVASFTASSLARVGPNKVAFNAARLGGMAYLIPFLIVYNDDILLKGVFNLGDPFILLNIVLILFGTILFSISLVGYLFGDLSLIVRLILLVTSLTIMFPLKIGEFKEIFTIMGLIISLVIFGVRWFMQYKRLSTQ